MLVRECATDHYDLPHMFQRAAVGDACLCGRPESDPLHEPNVTEKASLAPRFETERGS